MIITKDSDTMWQSKIRPVKTMAMVLFWLVFPIPFFFIRLTSSTNLAAPAKCEPKIFQIKNKFQTIIRKICTWLSDIWRLYTWSWNKKINDKCHQESHNRNQKNCWTITVINRCDGEAMEYLRSIENHPLLFDK